MKTGRSRVVGSGGVLAPIISLAITAVKIPAAGFAHGNGDLPKVECWTSKMFGWLAIICLQF